MLRRDFVLYSLLCVSVLVMPAHIMHAAACSHYCCCGYCLYSAKCTVVATANSAPNETNDMSCYLAYMGVHNTYLVRCKLGLIWKVEPQ